MRELVGTEQRVLAALRESEERYRCLVEMAQVAILILEDDCIRYCNPVGVAMLGAPSAEALLGRPIGPFFHPDERDLAAARRQTIRATGQPIPPRPFRVLRLDGQQIDVEASGAPCLYQGRPAIQVVFSNISERKRAEEALRESEARYRAIFDNAVEGFFQTTPGGAFLNLNPALACIYGYESPAEVIAHFKDVGAQLYVDPNRRREFIRLMADHGTVKGFEFEIRRKDGSHAWVSECTRTVRDPAGKILWYEGTVEDITDRKLAEEDLRQSQARYFTLINNLPVSLITKDRTGRFTYANDQFCAFVGKPLDEIIGKTDFDFFPRELAAAYQEDDRRVIESNTLLNKEELNQAPGAQLRQVQVLKVPVRDRLGQAIGVQIIFWDITERKRAEEALRQSEERIRLILDNAQHGLWDWEIATGREFLCDRWYAIHGYGPGERLPTYELWEQSIHPEDKPRVLAALQQHLQSSAHLYDVDYRARTKNGAWIWVNTRGRVNERDADGKPLRMMGTIHDITERKQAEAALAAVNLGLANLNAAVTAAQAELDRRRGSHRTGRKASGHQSGACQ